MIMKLVLLFGAFLTFQFSTTQQQQVCRVVSVCDGQQPTTDALPANLKGERGEVGKPGKKGPPGPPGPRGPKGSQGPSPEQHDLVALLETLSDYVTKIAAKLSRTSNKLDNLYLDVHPSATARPPTRPITPALSTSTSSLPASCKTSQVGGRQLLRSGDEVYCEDGWQVFQSRFDGSVRFDRYWTEYRNGFGNLTTEFWMGLEKLHRITAASTRCRLRVDLWDFSDNHVFAEYNTFAVGNERNSYRLTIAGYSGTAGNDMTPDKECCNLNGIKFTTRDRDNDKRPGYNCATNFRGKGGGWYNGCGYFSLHGRWSSTSSSGSSMGWYSWRNRYGGVKASKMKVKCA